MMNLCGWRVDRSQVLRVYPEFFKYEQRLVHAIEGMQFDPASGLVYLAASHTSRHCRQRF